MRNSLMLVGISSILVILNVRGDTTNNDDDVIEVVSEIASPKQTMLPLPLALQMSTTEATMNELPMESTTELINHKMGIKTFEQAILEAQNQFDETVSAQKIAEQSGEITTISAKVEDKDEKPMVSVDYQADAPVVASPATVYDNDNVDDVIKPISTEKIQDLGAGDVADVIKPISIEKQQDLVAKETEVPYTIGDNIVTVSAIEPVEEIMATSDKKESTAEEVVPQTNILEGISNAAEIMSGPLGMLKCFGCLSTTDASCIRKPVNEIDCKGSQDTQKGCYTLIKVDLNTTTRGCISDLTEEGMNYCKTNTKLCTLCYTDGCNNRVAPSGATYLVLEARLMLLLGIIVFANIVQ